ncbi:uncharacterized protein SCHCODRAFT_02690320 [Schizophyllum commune H4-8]|nr:uncharacterized protein SCHCODRAFT_02690320 [Schizophyllum commune H4-8]KAI5890354.1 hypothetical protein SCHCODRAFT_02690320 [Schizophyllum commune H4-8]
MTDTRNLRILYTINANPQYILARTLRPVEVSILPDAPDGPSSPQARYATAQLKPCLDAVCRSSPELLQDKSRDFSVYLLDPLESSFVATKQGLGFDRGVAVGLGLLSTANEIADTPVTGTVVRLPTNQEAVEIILSFTETRASRRNPSPLPPPAPVSQAPTPTEPAPPPAPAKTHATRNSLTLTRAVSLPASSSSAASSSAQPSKAPPNWSLVNPSKAKKKPPQKLKEPQTVSYTNEPYAHAPRADYIFANTQTYIGPKTKKGRPTQPPSNGSQMWVVGPSASTPSTTTSTTTSAASTPASAPGPSPAHAPSPLPAPSPIPAPSPSPAAAPIAAMSPPTIPTGENLSQEAKHNLLDVLALIMACSGDATQQAALLASLSTIDSSSPEQTAVVLEQIKAVLLRGRSAGPQALGQAGQAGASLMSQPPPAQTSQSGTVVLDKENCNPSPSRRTGKEVAASTSSTPAGVQNSAPAQSRSGLQNSTSKSNAAPVVVPPAAPAPNEAAASSHAASSSRKRTFDQFAAGMSARVGRSKEQRRQSGSRDQRRQSGSGENRLQSGSGENRVPATSPVRGPARQSVPFGRAHSSNDASSQRTASTSHRSPSASHRQAGASHRVVSASSPVRPPNRRPYTVPSWARTDTATQPRLSEEALRAQREADAKRREVRLARKRERRVARQGADGDDDSYSESGGDFSSNAGKGSMVGRSAKASASTINNANAKSKPVRPIAALPLFPSSSSFPISSSADLPPPSTPPRRRAGSLPATPDELGGSLFTPSTPRGLRAPTTPVTPRRHRPSPIKTPRSKSVGADGADEGGGEWDDDDDFLSKELSESPSAGRSSDMRRFDSSDARRFNSGYVPPSSPLPPSSPPRSSPLDHPMELEMEDGDETILSPEPLVGTPDTADGLGGRNGADGHPDGLELSSDEAFDMLQLFSDSDGMLGSEGLNDAPGIDMSMFENGLADMDFTEFWQSMGPLLNNSGSLGEGGDGMQGGGGLQEGAGLQQQDMQHGTWDGTTFGTGQQAESVQDVHSLFSGCLL